MKIKWNRLVAFLLVLSMIGSVAATSAVYDLSGDGKTDVWDLQLAVNGNKDAADKNAALDEALGGGDELHKNEDGHYEIWSSLGLYNMAANAEAGDTFVLMQDIDLKGYQWTPIENFTGKLEGNMHTIRNMKINESADGNMGFFASIGEGGCVSYLSIDDVNLIASDDAVNIGLMAGTCAGTIDGCTTIGFVTDERTSLPGDVYVGGMAGKMLTGGAIISQDVNKLPEVGAEQAINTISSYIGVRFTTESGHIVGIVGDGEAAVDSGTLLQNLTGTLPDPQAIAWVYTGDKAAFPLTVKDLIAAIDPTGNSVVTLQQDISYTQAIRLPYSCTFDCNGYTVATPATQNNGFQIDAVGSENETFTLKNGTLTHYEIGVYAGDGAVVLSNMTIVSEGGAPLGLYTTKDYSDINRIEDCTLVSKKWHVITYNKADRDMSANGITIENSKLITAKPAGNVIFGTKTTLPGTVTLGSNVDLYTYNDTITGSVVVEGVDPVKLADLASVTVLDKTYSDLNHWTTDESVISTELMAEVTNGTETVQVTNVTDMLANINADGNTKIKLMRDIERTSQIKLPYSCHIDLNDFSITATSGNALMIAGVGSDNTITTIENGTLNHGVLGVRVDAGSLHLSDVQINGIGNSGASVGFYDPSAEYKDGNLIENCTLYNPYSECIKYFYSDTDFNKTGVAIENTTLIAAKNYPFGVTTARMSGIVDLGQGVEIYSPKTAVAGGSLYRFLGLVAYRTEKTSVTVNGKEITGLCHWSTDNQKDIIDILLIGNSYSTTIPQELYNIATNAGYEVNVANIYYPGCVASQHWDWTNNPNEDNAYGANYQYRHQSQMGNYLRRGDMSTSIYALEDEDWDVIVYQDWFPPKYTKYPAANASTLEELYANHQEPAYNMMQYLKKNYPDAQHYYYQHWAWQIGHSTIPDEETRDAMWDRINTASTKFAADNDFILIPCGAAFELARQNEKIGDAVYDTDKFHDGAAGGGQYLNGCIFFETIFRESCIGDTWRASNGPSEEVHQILQQIAHQTIINVHGEDYVK